MTPRVAALALAAIPLTTAPALADAPASHTAQTALGGVSLNLGDASLYVSIGDNRWRGQNGRSYSRSPYGQNPWEVRRMREAALQRCAGAIQRQGYRIGYRSVDIDDDVRIRQIGHDSFKVRFDEIDFESRGRDVERNMTCTVQRGQVTRLDGLPNPNRRRYGWDRGHDRDWDRSRDHDWNDRDRDRDYRRTGPGGQRLYGGREED